MGCCVSFHQIIELHEWVVYRTATEPLHDGRVSHHDKTTTNSNLHEAGSAHWLTRRDAQPSGKLWNGNGGRLRLCNKVRAARP